MRLLPIALGLPGTIGFPTAIAHHRSPHGQVTEVSYTGKNFIVYHPSHSNSAPTSRMDCFVDSLLARIIHQPEKSTREDPFGGQMVLNTTVLQDHHDPTTSSADGLYMASIDLIGAIRRTASRQPPRADNHRFALEPPEVSIALTGPEALDVHPLTTLHSASILTPPGTTRATKS